MEEGKFFHVIKSQTKVKEPLLLQREQVENTVERNMSVSSKSRANFIAPKSHLTSSSLNGSSLIVLLVADEVSVVIF